MFDEFINIRKELELPTDEFDLYKLANLYNQRIKEYYGEQKVNKYIIWDYELMSCIEKNVLAKNYDGARLVSRYGWSNGYEWPDIKNFEDERSEFYDFCLNNTENIVMKIRYLDYLVDNGDNDKKYEYAKQLVDYLISFCESIEDYLKFNSYVSRLVDISVRFRMKEKMKDAEKLLIEKANTIIAEEKYRWIIEISEILRYLGFYKGNKRISQKTIDIIIAHLDTARKHYWGKDYHLYRSVSWSLVEWYKAENYSDECLSNLLEQIGFSFEKQAEDQDGKSNLLKAHFLEDAIQHYINIGKRHMIPEIKAKIKKAYREMVNSNELHMISTDIEINKDDIKKETEKFKLDNLDMSFELLSRTNYYILPLEKIKEETEKTLEEAVFSKFVNLSSIYDGRKVFQSVSEEDRFKHNLYQTYDIGLRINFGIIFKDVWDYLISEGLTSDKVVARITEWNYMDEQNKIIVEQGLKRFFDEDYISSLHILVPQFESCFRKFFEYYGYPTTSIKARTVQYEQTFGDFLKNDFVKNNIDNNLLYFIKFVMVDDLGYNLRNNIAHGLAGVGMFNYYVSLIVIYMFFMLTNYMWKTNEEEIE